MIPLLTRKFSSSFTARLALLIYLGLMLSDSAAAMVFTTNMDATTVVGQLDFTAQDATASQSATPQPLACAVSATGKFAVAEQSTGRVLLWNSVPTNNGTPANIVVGKPDFTTAGFGLSQSSLGSCMGVAFSPDGQKLIVSDTGNHRILIWNTIPTVNGAPADVVIGQSDFTTGTSGTSASKFYAPTGILVTPDGRMLVADKYNNRVLVWNAIPTSNIAADVVIGQSSKTTSLVGSSNSRMNGPLGLALASDGRLLVGDEQNHRVLVFSGVPTNDNASAIYVIGQTGFGSSSPATTSTGLNYPGGVSVSSSGQVAISDFGNHRVLIFNSIPTTNGAAADVVLGQPDFISGTMNNGGLSAHSMRSPCLLLFAPDGRLILPCRDNKRVMIYAPPIPPPTVTAINPASGPISGNTGVEITGTGFTGATDVTIGGIPLLDATIESDTSILGYTPPHAAGAVSVDVTTPYGSNAPNSLYTYVSPDYNITTIGGILTITDMSGNSDTLALSTPNTGTIQFSAPGRTFSVNGAVLTTGSSNSIPLTWITSVVVNTAAGNNTINVAALSGTMPSLTLNGGTGNDTVNLNGNITFASNANLDVDLQNDSATPGIDVFNVNTNAQITTSGIGTIAVRVSKSAQVASGAKLQTQNGDLIVEANQGTLPTSGAFIGLLNAGVIQTNGTGNIAIAGTGGDAAPNFNVGTSILGSVVASGGGNVQLTGNAGSSNSFQGLQVTSGGSITSPGGGGITLSGTSANNTPGKEAISIGSSGPATVNAGGNLTMTGDSIAIHSTNASLSSGNTVFLGPKTTGRSVDLGAVDSPSALGLTDTELDRLTVPSNGSVLVGSNGNANGPYGPVVVSGEISPLNYRALRFWKDVTFTATGGFVSRIESNLVFDKMTMSGSGASTVTITPGATLTLLDPLNYTWPPGYLFLILGKTSGTPISGTFTLNTPFPVWANYSAPGSGQNLTVSLPELPTVITSPAVPVTTTSAAMGGQVTSAGGVISEQGIVWSTATIPTNVPPASAGGVTKVPNGTSPGVFSATIGGLPPLTQISYRAYAINQVGYSYGPEVVFTTPAAGAPDPLDLNIVGTAVTSAVHQPDGKTIIFGAFTSVGGVARNNIARLNADDTVDLTFNPNANGNVSICTLLEDGRMLVGGNFTNIGGQPRQYLARLDQNGVADGFDPNPNAIPQAILVQYQGGVVIGGRFTTISGVSRSYLARYDLDVLDTDFSQTNHWVETLAEEADGNLLIGGRFTTIGGQARPYLARTNKGGDVETSFAPAPNGLVFTVAVQASGEILVGGTFTNIGGGASNRAARLSAAGALDPSFSPNFGPTSGNNWPVCINTQTNGKILIGGWFTSTAGIARNRVARFNADGSLDTYFDPAPDAVVSCVSQRPDGRIWLTGQFNNLQPNGGSTLPRSLVARLYNDPATQTLTAPNNTSVSWARSGAGPEIEQVTFDVSTNNGLTWTSLGSGSRAPGTGWTLTSLNLPPSGTLRARGRTTGHYESGSSGIIEQQVGYSVSTPEIVVEHPVGVALSGGVVAWGYNASGQTTVPAGLTGVTAIAAGLDHTVALKSDGTVVAWGSDPIGYGETTVPAGLTGVTAIAAASGHTVALKSDGTVVAWGDNFYGETTVPAGWTGVTAISAGHFYTVALKSDGTVVAWGRNVQGQATVPAGLTGVTAISASDHTVALKSDGTVVAWGRNNEGQTTVPAGLTGVTAISAGSTHTVALKSDGTVVAWGSNNEGQTSVPVGLTGVTAISAGSYHTVALKSDGSVVAWGSNNYGTSIGGGQTTVPAGLTAVTAISAGGYHTVALTSRSTIDFGSQIVATTSAPKTITIKNTGNGPLIINGISNSGGNASDFSVNTTGMLTSVPAGGSTTFDVSFTPSDVGPRQTTLRILNNDYDEGTFDITLTGTGIPAPNVAPSFNLATDAGASWTPRYTNQNWFGITSSADGTKLAAIANNGFIYTSTDAGVNWTPRGTSRLWGRIVGSADGTKLATTEYNGNIYTSSDSGVTWTARATDTIRQWYGIACSSDGTKLIASDYGGYLYTSMDSGVTWTATKTDANRNWYGTASSADGTKLAAIVNGGEIHISTDSGATWTVSGPTLAWSAITSSADGTKLAATTFNDKIYTSTDSGATWTARESSRNWYAIASSADGGKLAAAANGLIYTSADSGVSWTPRATSLPWHGITMSADGNRLAAVATGGQIHTSQGVPPPNVITCSGPASISDLVINISPGPSIESAQTVTFTVTNDNNALFTVQPAIAPDGTLTFTSGCTAGTAIVTVIAVDNGGTANGGIDTSAPQTFTITVTDPMNDWRMLHFGSAANSGNGATTADPDSDGLSNLIEYAFGLDPNSGSSVQTPPAVLSGGNLVSTYTVPSGMGCITYEAEWSTDLILWFPIPDTGSGNTHIFSVPVGSNPKMFLRHRITEH